MSAAAEASAKHVIHPKVKGSRRALLDTIATLIPEGETMTRPIDDDELAARSGYRESSIYRARKFLVAHRLIRVIGGQGKVASYALWSMTDAPALPLIGVAKPVRSRVIETPLLDVPRAEVSEAPIRSYTVGQNDGGWRSYFRHFDGGWRTNFRHFRHLRHFWAYTVGHFDGSSRMDVDVTRARDHVQPLQTRTTTARPREERPNPPTSCRWHGTVHAWCAFRMHVPMTLHREELRHLARGATETAADLEARQYAIYAEEAAALPDDEPIPDPNELAFWKRVLQARRRRECERAPPITHQRPMRPPDIVGGTVCPHTPRCDRTTACIERMVAEDRAARAQRSG